MRRWLTALAGSIVLLFGLGCLNYTFGDGIEHHREVARRNGWPEPGRPVFYLGVACVVLGAGAVGHAVGARSASGGVGR